MRVKWTSWAGTHLKIPGPVGNLELKHHCKCLHYGNWGYLQQSLCSTNTNDIHLFKEKNTLTQFLWPLVGSPFRKVTPELLLFGEISDHLQNKIAWRAALDSVFNHSCKSILRFWGPTYVGIGTIRGSRLIHTLPTTKTKNQLTNQPWRKTNTSRSSPIALPSRIPLPRSTAGTCSIIRLQTPSRYGNNWA